MSKIYCLSYGVSCDWSIGTGNTSYTSDFVIGIDVPGLKVFMPEDSCLYVVEG